MMSGSRYDAIVVGGGFYGCSVALTLARAGARVALLERCDDIQQRASSVNQARVHNGYHYPRSILTGLRSRVNCRKFLDEFEDCIDRSFRHYYAVSRRHGNVTALQFESFCRRIEAPLSEAPAHVAAWFDPALVERVYEVEEWIFDASKLKARTLARLERARVDLHLGTTARRVAPADGGLRVETSGSGNGSAQELFARWVFNCTYAHTNDLLRHSGLDRIPLRLELAEIALVEVPSELLRVGLTLVCGPFFSTLPFPAGGVHSFSHVRYTPHCTWEDGGAEPVPWPDAELARTRFLHMVKDAARYVPLLEQARYVRSLFEVKALLPESEANDSRPILLRRSRHLPGLVSILGGKIDNVYDLPDELVALVRDEARDVPLDQPVRIGGVVPPRPGTDS